MRSAIVQASVNVGDLLLNAASYGASCTLALNCQFQFIKCLCKSWKLLFNTDWIFFLWCVAVKVWSHSNFKFVIIVYHLKGYKICFFMNILLKFVCLWTMPNLSLQCGYIPIGIYGVQFCTNMTKNENDDRSVNHFSWSAVLKSSHVCRHDKWLTSWQQYKTMTSRPLWSRTFLYVPKLWTVTRKTLTFWWVLLLAWKDP